MLNAPMKTKRRFFQYSMRTLGVAMLLCAVLLAWVRQVWQRHEATRQLEAVGVAVSVDPAPRWLNRMVGKRYGRYFDKVTAADLSVGVDDWSELWWVRIHGLAEIVDENHLDDLSSLLGAKYSQYGTAGSVVGGISVIPSEVTTWAAS